MSTLGPYSLPTTTTLPSFYGPWSEPTTVDTTAAVEPVTEIFITGPAGELIPARFYTS